MRDKAEPYIFTEALHFQLYRLANSFHVRLSQRAFYTDKNRKRRKKSAQRFTLFQGLLIQEILKCNWLSGLHGPLEVCYVVVMNR